MHISAGDTAWMLTSTALVLFMMPGVGLQVDPEQEQAGLDLAEHGEPAYDDLSARVRAMAGVTPNGGSAATSGL